MLPYWSAVGCEWPGNSAADPIPEGAGSWRLCWRRSQPLEHQLEGVWAALPWSLQPTPCASWKHFFSLFWKKLLQYSNGPFSGVTDSPHPCCQSQGHSWSSFSLRTTHSRLPSPQLAPLLVSVAKLVWGPRCVSEVWTPGPHTLLRLGCLHLVIYHQHQARELQETPTGITGLHTWPSPPQDGSPAPPPGQHPPPHQRGDSSCFLVILTRADDNWLLIQKVSYCVPRLKSPSGDQDVPTCRAQK